MNIEDRLDEIQELADAATEGVWTWELTTPSMSGTNWTLRINGKPGIRMSVSEYQHGTANAEFITDARTSVPQLVAMLKALISASQEHRSIDRLNECVCPACVGYQNACVELGVKP